MLDEDIARALDNSNIKSFEYEGELNNPLLTGSLTYLDGHGYIDAFLEKQETILNVVFAEIDELDDGVIPIETVKPEKRYNV